MARLLGKTRAEVEEILKNNDIIELRLSEKRARGRKENDDLRICE